ncbi:MAG: alcohol dehydrogenase catalytic domain-containing protein [Rhizobiaceae bacterium]|nr:alcohol dehydrogenase catalytic domain-containing protein [Rhizobiaceae bacterium]
MRAACLYAADDLRIEDVAEPVIVNERDVLLRVEMAGICGSDLHNFHTGQWISRSPSVPGHEFVATVLKTGAGVSALKVGDRVVADSRMPCLTCEKCRSGQGYLCSQMGFVGEVNDGGFAPLTVQAEQQLIRLPDQSVPSHIAVLAEPLAVALHAVNRLGTAVPNDVLVMGAGTIGALTAILLQHRGVRNIALFDTNQERRKIFCKALGLDMPGAGELQNNAFDACIDTTGSVGAFETSLSSVKRGGDLVVVGLYGKNITFDMNRIVEGGLRLSGCAAFDNELEEAVLLLAELAPKLACLTCRQISLDDVPAMYGELSSGASAVQKALIRHDVI